MGPLYVYRCNCSIIICREVISELKEAGASWIQFDEPTLVMDLESHKLEAFTEAYSELESTVSGLNVLIETYFADIPAKQYKTLTSLKGVTALGFDLVRGTKTLDLIKGEFPKGKYLFAGVVDGRNIWANDLAASLSTLEALEGIVGKGTYSFLLFFACIFGTMINIFMTRTHS
jgi:5-methyltetrahydropteroyltriglutamate--homocysteine methyltransferase